jgi:hypothetical protein
MKQEPATKKVKEMIRSIETIGSQVSTKRGETTREIASKLKDNKKKCADMLASSYNEAFNIHE